MTSTIKENPDINFALVEEKRPSLYRSMKYWGKKPHNVWRQYIENYTPSNGIYLDPFAGSAISAFEAVKVGRKVIAFDLNPLSTFFIEVLSSNFDPIAFKNAADNIINTLEDDDLYIQHYKTKCEKCGEDATIVNFKWEKGIYEVAAVCDNCITGESSRNKKYYFIVAPGPKEIVNSEDIKNIVNHYWYPNQQFPKSVSFSASFVKSIGSNNYSDLWTKRNLYVLSKIFHLILKEKSPEIKIQLLSSFIQTVHLATKMCVPRRENANRAFSTSWGRSAFLASRRQTEMNPVVLFRSSCFGRQSTTSMLRNNYKYLGVDLPPKKESSYNVSLDGQKGGINGKENLHSGTDYQQAEGS